MAREDETEVAEGNGASLAESARDRLRAAIRAHQFRPGQRMREIELAEMLGISRTPLRDALRALAAEGLLEAAPRRGLVVASLDQQQVAEIYALRKVLDAFAARLAASNASGAEVATLRDNLKKQERARDPVVLARLNDRFHAIVFRASRNRYLVSSLENLERALMLLPGSTYAAPGRADEALRHHTELVDAIESHDGDRAAELALEHLATAERIRLIMLAESYGSDEA